MTDIFFRLMRRAAWAPALVLIFHAFVIRSPYHAALDNLNHFLGGAAAAFFVLEAIRLSLPRLPSIASHLFAFGLACAAAVFWEIAEFTFDQLLGSDLQGPLEETMGDLISGVVGAAVTLLALMVFRKTKHDADPDVANL